MEKATENEWSVGASSTATRGNEDHSAPLDEYHRLQKEIRDNPTFEARNISRFDDEKNLKSSYESVEIPPSFKHCLGLRKKLDKHTEEKLRKWEEFEKIKLEHPNPSNLTIGMLEVAINTVSKNFAWLENQHADLSIRLKKIEEALENKK